MNRVNRIALLAAAVLILLAAGSVLANRSPAAGDVPAAPASSHEPGAEGETDAPPTAEDLARVEERLLANGIPFDESVLNDLAARYGVGGAVRVLAWAQAADMDVAAITAKRDGTDTEAGMGWGRIAKDLEVHPGIGEIMGNGHGRDSAPGQLKQAPEE